jgi:ABC-2 type transport system permease protein
MSTIPASPLAKIGAVHKVKTWWMMIRISLEERLAYRGDFALGTLMRFLPIVTQIFLWGAIFNAVAAQSGNDENNPPMLGGYSLPEMVAYFLMTMIARAFSSMPGLASGIASQVRQGEIKKYLIQPVDLISFLLCTRIAHKLAYYVVATLPFAFVFFLCRGFFTQGFPPPAYFIAFLGSLVMGFMIGFFLEATIGMISFWLLEVNSLLLIFMLFSFFLSGHMFPLSLLPPDIEWFVNLLPLKYLAFFPAAIFLQKIPEDELATEMAIEAGWVVFFIIVCRWMYERGLKRYSGFGG